MARPCSVCAHLKRAEIDILLSRQAVNVVQLGRSYGLSRDALRAHRTNHLPSFLAAFTAQADGLALRQLTAESERLYLAALDNLARAEAGTLERIVEEEEETGQRIVTHRARVSVTAVSRAIREARSQLDQLVQLSATHEDEKGAPVSHDAELGAAIRAQLERVVAKRADPPLAALEEGSVMSDAVEAEDAVLVGDQRPAPQPGATGTQGPSAGSTGEQLPPPHSPDSQPHQLGKVEGGLGNPAHLPVDTPDLPVDQGEATLSPEQVQAAARAAGITPESLMAFLTRKRLPRIMHPEWTGNPAASKEERAAAGYADIEVADHRLDP